MRKENASNLYNNSGMDYFSILIFINNYVSGNHGVHIYFPIAVILQYFI